MQLSVLVVIALVGYGKNKNAWLLLSCNSKIALAQEVRADLDMNVQRPAHFLGPRRESSTTSRMYRSLFTEFQSMGVLNPP